jgi:hypothetical protein
MPIDLSAFSLYLDPLAIAGVSLWALALYLSFAGFRQGVTDGLVRWFDFAERSLYLSQEEFDQSRPARESQNAFWASVLGILPFLLLGGLCYYSLTVGLGQSWAISVGIMWVILSGLYELARRSQR